MKILKLLTLSLFLITYQTCLQGAGQYKPGLKTIGEDEDWEIHSFSDSDDTSSTLDEEDSDEDEYDTCGSDSDSDDETTSEVPSYDVFPVFAPLTQHPTHKILDDRRKKLKPILELSKAEENDPEEPVIPLGKGY